MSYEEIKLAEIDAAVNDKPDAKEIWAKTRLNFADHDARLDALEGIKASVLADHFVGEDTVVDISPHLWAFETFGVTGTSQIDLNAANHTVTMRVSVNKEIRLLSRRRFYPRDLPSFETRVKFANLQNAGSVAVRGLFIGLITHPTIQQWPTNAIMWRKHLDELPQFVALDDRATTPFARGDVSDSLPQPANGTWVKIRFEFITETVVECYQDDILFHTFAKELGDEVPDNDTPLIVQYNFDYENTFGAEGQIIIDWVVARNAALLDTA